MSWHQPYEASTSFLLRRFLLSSISFSCQFPTMRAFCSKTPLLASSDARTLESILQCRFCSSWNTSRRPYPLKWNEALKSPSRGVKTKTSMKVQDLPQGVIGMESLPDLEADDAPQYPTVVQGAKNNMIKFKDCVVLTRVGNFYEVFAILESWDTCRLTFL